MYKRQEINGCDVSRDGFISFVVQQYSTDDNAKMYEVEINNPTNIIQYTSYGFFKKAVTHYSFDERFIFVTNSRSNVVQISRESSSPSTITQSTIAGSGTVGNQDGSQSQATFQNIYNLELSESGRFLYVLCRFQIRRIDLDAETTSGNYVTTVAGDGYSGGTDGNLSLIHI